MESCYIQPLRADLYRSASFSGVSSRLLPIADHSFLLLHSVHGVDALQMWFFNLLKDMRVDSIF